MGQLLSPYVPNEKWVIHQEKHGLLDGLSNTICLPVHDVEPVYIDWVSCGLAVLINGGCYSEVFP